MKEKLKTQSGFTLVEVVVAIVIITALVGTFAPLIVSSIERIQWAGERTKELYTVRGNMEREVAVGTKGIPYSFSIRGPNDFNGTAKGNLVQVQEGRLELVTFLAPRDW